MLDGWGQPPAEPQPHPPGDHAAADGGGVVPVLGTGAADLDCSLVHQA